MALQTDERTQVSHVADALVAQFAGRVPAEDVRGRVAAELERFSGARIRTYLPVLLQRRVARDLRDTTAAG